MKLIHRLVLVASVSSTPFLLAACKSMAGLEEGSTIKGTPSEDPFVNDAVMKFCQADRPADPSVLVSHTWQCIGRQSLRGNFTTNTLTERFNTVNSSLVASAEIKGQSTQPLVYDIRPTEPDYKAKWNSGGTVVWNVIRMDPNDPTTFYEITVSKMGEDQRIYTALCERNGELSGVNGIVWVKVCTAMP